MANEYEFHHRTAASRGESDEYWTLIVPDSGTPRVRLVRFWGHLDLGEMTQSEPQITPLKEFLANSHPATVHDKLIGLLQKLGIDPNA